MAFPPLGNSDVVVSVSIDIPSNSQWDAPFDHIAYDYSHADWDSLCDHLRGVSWEDIFKLGASAAASEFWGVGSGWNWCIYLSYKISDHASLISMVFSCLCSFVPKG